MSITEAEKKAKKKYNAKVQTYTISFPKERNKEILNAFSQYCEENGLSNSGALKHLMIKGLVDAGYLESYHLFD